MGLSIVVVEPWLGWQSASAAGIAALLVGILDQRRNPAERLRTMGIGTVMLAVTTLVSRELSPWPLAVVALLALIAFAEGAGIAVHRDAPVVLQLNGIVVATALLEPEPQAGAAQAALVVLAAGAAQALVSWFAALRLRVIREFDFTASAMRDVSAYLRRLADPANDPRSPVVAAALERSRRSLSAAQRAVAVSDLAPETLALLQKLLFASDQMRVEGLGFVVTPGAEQPVATEASAQVRRRFDDLSRLLAQAANALRHKSGGSDVEQAVAAYPARDPAGAFGAAVRELLEANVWRRRSAAVPGARRAKVRSAIRPGGQPFLYGVRIAVASLAAGLIGSTVNLVHASWSVNAALSVLRPDGGGVVTRFVLRGGATALAAVVVVAEVAALSGNRYALAVAAVVFAYVMYLLGPTNYGIYAMMVTVSVLTLAIAAGGNPQSLALDRLVDTLIGSALALAAGFAIPVWKVTALPDDLAGFCATLAERFRDISRVAAQAPDGRDQWGLRASGIRTRDAIADLVATLDAVSLEPGGRLPVAEIRVAFAELHDAARMAIVAERLLDQGAPASMAASELAAHTASALDTLAAAIRARRPDREEVVVPVSAGDASGLEVPLTKAVESVIRAADVQQHLADRSPG
jgi:uncharacterized membrane protein YccC